jgi:hypothetical protein
LKRRTSLDLWEKPYTKKLDEAKESNGILERWSSGVMEEWRNR